LKGWGGGVDRVAIGKEKDPIDQMLGRSSAACEAKEVWVRLGWTRAEQAVDSFIMRDAHKQTATTKKILFNE